MAKRKPKETGPIKSIGAWSEVKVAIVEEYAARYLSIMKKQQWCEEVAYIDGFSASGLHMSRTTGRVVAGSAAAALALDPPFDAYYFVDLDATHLDHLKEFSTQFAHAVYCVHGDANVVLPSRILPRFSYESHRRALCLLDPYGLHLDWSVVEMAGKLRTVDLLIHFPVMDMNRNALWKQPEKVDEEKEERMTRFWGDESWKEAAYRETGQTDMFEDTIERAKRSSRELVNTYVQRLKNIAGFKTVCDPKPMQSSTNALLYYLAFASQKPVATKIMQAIFNRASRGDFDPKPGSSPE